MASITRKSSRRRTESILAGDPLWFKDAVIYQLHIRAFYDGNDDGIGDFIGLTEKLDYIKELGVTAIWILPFFVSPLRDDGYDIADYTRINPAYGNLKDFQNFLHEAHARDLKVITELVMNHTSDQHEWFQRSRRAKPGEKYRDYYVWSDTNERYQEARIIFQDFETSNWTWDPVANAYYWHRFYHHQPDLNFDNPAVHQAMFGIIDFWLEMGVDGVRLDAVPYLYERDGTNCENLPETHAFLQKLRAHVDEAYPDRMLLAEANQWPEDAAVYFGDGNECHMNFHFPLMPRLFMAIEREDRFPIIDILEQTPQIPENCQWGIFLRNHDELTLEMVTDEERDYMYRAYADDPNARINLGIRRRLAPLLRDNRRKMELMNALLLSLPGTPIIYYGDEIRMGDNIYLGDRDGVRTPMQWSDDRNAGFSRVNPQRLFLPVIIDSPYHYSSRNVEVEQSRPHSMLWWMRRIIGLRKQYPAFGRGTVEFLSPENTKVLAYLRHFQGETLLIVANLSRYVQCAEIDLSRFRGQAPVELFGETQFPPIGELPYFLTLGPYALYWFRLDWRGNEAKSLDVELPVCKVEHRWDALFEGKPLTRLEAALPGYLQRHRWFAGKTQSILRTKLLDVLTLRDVPKVTEDLEKHGRLHGKLPNMRILIVKVNFVVGEAEIYAIPSLFAEGEQAKNILGDHPSAGILKIERSDGKHATLCDSTHEAVFWLLLLDAIDRKRTLTGLNGEVLAMQTKAFDSLEEKATASDSVTNGHALAAATSTFWDVSFHSGEQSNTSAAFGGRFLMKLFRKLSEGVNPEAEIGEYLTQKTDLTCIPQMAGALEYVAADGDRFTFAVLHEFVPNSGDAWTSTLDELGRYLERIETEMAGVELALPTSTSLMKRAEEKVPNQVKEVIGPFIPLAELLGTRTAELHLALAAGTDKSFAPEPFSKLYQRSLYQSMRGQARRTMSLLRKQRPRLSGTTAERADILLANEAELLHRYRDVMIRRIHAQRIRCHGDFHLGQVLYTGKDFVIIDFEGEPDRSVGERRIKASPLRDVASMIRSFHYASRAVLEGPHLGHAGPSGSRVSAWLNAWYLWTAAAYLRAYLAAAAKGAFLPEDQSELEILLNAYLLEQAVDELDNELTFRPDWVRLPLEGILQLLEKG